MRIGFYPRLALEGIRKNKRMYVPYLLTGSVMVMMFYILRFLAGSPALMHMRGGSTLKELLPLGAGVIGIFSLLFLFYTNSFLIRQRYREFGLYNILGMDKRNVGRIMVVESLIVGLTVIVSGLIVGTALSKAAELVMLNLLRLEVTFELSIDAGAIGTTTLVYGIIYLILLLNSLLRVRRAKPLELMQSNKVGEKVPKRTWVYAVLGLILLGIAYYLAISIEEPMVALVTFFVAVIMVIVATYLLFISGSVVLYRLLQKNKKYYYQPNHFVSVSSMVYRMKRNGAGLASICILLTMVLVMISSSASLYFGEEDCIRSRYPNGVNLSVTFENTDGIRPENVEALCSDIIDKTGMQKELNGICVGEIPGVFTEEGVIIDYGSYTDFSLSTYGDIGFLTIVSLEDYNRMSGNEEILTEDECMLYCVRTEYTADTFTMENGKPYKVKKVLREFYNDGEYNAMIIPNVCIVVKDVAAFAEPVLSMANSYGDPLLRFEWHCGFDFDTAEEEIAVADAIRDVLRTFDIEGKYGIYSYEIESREANRAEFFELYGSLFFLGIMLSFVFLLAAVLIIYYKQLSEGYEDRSRFEIMQKVGMTKKEIRRSINSQVLTVFFSPLAFAGVHLAFAFPFVWRILMLFNLSNQPFVIAVTALCFVIFGLFYALVYKITSNSYYSIVSGR